jgi:hypothetical protein
MTRPPPIPLLASARKRKLTHAVETVARVACALGATYASDPRTPAVAPQGMATETETRSLPTSLLAPLCPLQY